MNRTLLLLFVLCLSAPAARAQTYNLQDVGGSLYAQSDATGINDNGDVCGETWGGDYTYADGFVWRKGNAAILPANGFRATYTFGVNNAGTVVGTYFNSYYTYSTVFSYAGGTASGVVGGQYASGNAINNAGAIVGATETLGEAFLYAGGKETKLGFLRSQDDTSEAWAVNNADPVEIVGESSVQLSELTRATLWRAGKRYDLGTLGGPSAVAYGINDRGQIVGYADVPKKDADGNYYHHAFLWTPTTPNGTAGTMKDLSVLPGGLYSTAFAINNAGTVVGKSGVPSDEAHAFGDVSVFVWDAAHGLRDLLFAVAYTGTPLQGVQGCYFDGVGGINARGQIAVSAEFTVDSTLETRGVILSPTGETAPAAPAALQATVLPGQTNRANLSWQAQSVNEAGFALERKNGIAPFREIAFLAASTQTYVDATLQPGTLYAYRVRALNTFGASAYTNAAACVTGSTTLMVKSVTASPASALAGTPVNALVTLTGNAPAGGANIALLLDGRVLGNFVVASGKTSGTYTQSTAALLIGAHRLAAAFNGQSQAASFTVKTDTTKPVPKSLVFSPGTVRPGGATNGTVILMGKAPSGGADVVIAENGTVLGTLTVAAGQTSAAFDFTAGSAAGAFTETATYNGTQVKTTLTVR